MHIISKYKDYYDSAVGMGIDKTIVYVRDNKEFDHKEVPEDVFEIIGEETHSYAWSKSMSFKTRTFYCKKIGKKSYKLESFLVGFCGKLHVGFKYIELEPPQYKYGTPENKEIVDIIYDLDRVRELIDFKNEKYRKWYGGRRDKDKRAEFENYISSINSIDPHEIFVNYHTPTFIAGYGKFRINAILKDVEFAKAVDPYTAFQEIQMFISGVLGIEKDGTDVNMTEKDKVRQHGFDEKYGFRKRPKT